jgi:hypothetical protein
MKYLFSINDLQCDIANKHWNRSDCCANPSSANCNKPTHVWNIEGTLSEDYSIASDTGTTLNWTDVKLELGSRGRPFLVGISWKGYNSGHMLAARSYYWHDSGYKSIGLMDPGETGGTYVTYTWEYFNNNSVFAWSTLLWKIKK